LEQLRAELLEEDAEFDDFDINMDGNIDIDLDDLDENDDDDFQDATSEPENDDDEDEDEDDNSSSEAIPLVDEQEEILAQQISELDLHEADLDDLEDETPASPDIWTSQSKSGKKKKQKQKKRGLNPTLEDFDEYEFAASQGASLASNSAANKKAPVSASEQDDNETELDAYETLLTPEADKEVSEKDNAASGGKKKNKKDKKDKKKETKEKQAPGLVCNVCNTSFTSRNRLFDHIKEEGHAQQVKKGGKR
jgi:DnaJ family protein A protein 5